MAKQNFREINMDPLECLYYERMDSRKKAYAARRRKLSSRSRRMSMKNPQIYKIDAAALEPASCRVV